MPVKPGEQEQLTALLITLHSAFSPHDPGQGSWHFELIQDIVDGQSGFITHSGLQFGGVPMYDGRHAHSRLLFTFRQREFGPQVDGLQGSGFTSGGSEQKIINLIMQFNFFL